MIYGIGIDTVELDRISEAAQRSERFVRKVLTDREFVKYEKLASAHKKMNFLAGSWAAKEAYSKALGTGLAKGLHMRDIELDADPLGKPFFSRHPYDGPALVSMTDSRTEATAIVILEVKE